MSYAIGVFLSVLNLMSSSTSSLTSLQKPVNDAHVTHLASYCTHLQLPVERMRNSCTLSVSFGEHSSGSKTSSPQ